MPDVSTRLRQVQRQRAAHAPPRTASLLAAPTVAMRQRAVAAAVLDLLAPAVSDAVLHAVLDQAEALLAAVPAHSRPCPPAAYLAPAFGLGQPVQTRTQLAQALGVAPRTIRHWLAQDVAALRVQLARTSPDLWAAATAPCCPAGR